MGAFTPRFASPRGFVEARRPAAGETQTRRLCHADLRLRCETKAWRDLAPKNQEQVPQSALPGVAYDSRNRAILLVKSDHAATIRQTIPRFPTARCGCSSWPHLAASGLGADRTAQPGLDDLRPQTEFRHLPLAWPVDVSLQGMLSGRHLSGRLTLLGLAWSGSCWRREDRTINISDMTTSKEQHANTPSPRG